MADYKTPGVYINEISTLPPSVVAVSTAIPAFIGYTEKAKLRKDNDLLMTPYKVRSLFDYTRFYGKAMPEQNIQVQITQKPDSTFDNLMQQLSLYKYRLYQPLLQLDSEQYETFYALILRLKTEFEAIDDFATEVILQARLKILLFLAERVRF